jgi:hypothetical protein
VVFLESSVLAPNDDPSSWSDVLIFFVDLVNGFLVRLLSDEAAAFPKTRSDPILPQGALSFITEGATQPSTQYEPLTGSAPGGDVDPGPPRIERTPIYQIFSDP